MFLIEIIKFLHSKFFINSIPIYGYYTLKNGTKISILDFINNCLINCLQKASPSDYEEVLLRVAKEYLKPLYEVEEHYNIEKINKQYQRINNQIKNVQESIDCSLGDKQRGYDKYLIKNMELIIKLIDYEDKTAFDVFRTPIVKKTGFIYREFKPSQLKLFEDLKIASQVLTMDEFFNPNKTNYYNKFLMNYNVLKLEDDIEAYKKNTNSEPTYDENNATL